MPPVAHLQLNVKPTGHRLISRQTYIEWQKEILCSFRDTKGVEQGGCASDKYKLVNNEQLKTAQQSALDVDLGLVVTANGGLERPTLSAAGLADDVGLLSSTVGKSKLLLYLTKCTVIRSKSSWWQVRSSCWCLRPSSWCLRPSRLRCRPWWTWQSTLSQ